MKTGIFFGSNTGNTARVAKIIADRLDVAPDDIHNVANTAPSAVAPYDMLILGTSTWGNGELQDDWMNFINGLEMIDLRGKRIALFGLGDENMADTFCSGVGELYNRLKRTGAQFVGSYPANVYHFNSSEAVVDGRPEGLLLDDMNHPELTSGRIDGWLQTLEVFTEAR